MTELASEPIEETARSTLTRMFVEIDRATSKLLRIANGKERTVLNLNLTEESKLLHENASNLMGLAGGMRNAVIGFLTYFYQAPATEARVLKLREFSDDLKNYARELEKHLTRSPTSMYGAGPFFKVAADAVGDIQDYVGQLYCSSVSHEDNLIIENCAHVLHRLESKYPPHR